MPCRPAASRDVHASTRLPPQSSRPPRSARVVGQKRLVRHGQNRRPRARSATSPGSCGARRTCSRRRRAWSMPRCRAPVLFGPEARRARRRKSAVRSATSRCANLARDAGTTGLKQFPGPPACPLEQRAETSSWPIALSPEACSSLGSSRPPRLGRFTSRVSRVPFEILPVYASSTFPHSRAAARGRCV